MKLTRISVVLVCCLWLVCSIEGQKAPITGYRRGPSSRVEYITATIGRQHLDKGTSTNAATRAYAQRMGDRRDDAGHLIAQRLGGTGRDTYNIVPQSPNINRGIWRNQVESKIYNEVKKGANVVFEVWPRYKSSTDTRPHVLVYQAKDTSGNVIIRKNSIPNPLPKKSG